MGNLVDRVVFKCKLGLLGLYMISSKDLANKIIKGFPPFSYLLKFIEYICTIFPKSIMAIFHRAELIFFHLRR
jgi:hypothetical protein